LPRRPPFSPNSQSAPTSSPTPKQLLPIGFVEASLRSEYVNGTSTSPVAFLKGLYVVPQKYSVRVLPPEQRPWKMRDFVLIDPSEVLSRIAENTP